MYYPARLLGRGSVEQRSMARLKTLFYNHLRLSPKTTTRANKVNNKIRSIKMIQLIQVGADSNPRKKFLLLKNMFKLYNLIELQKITDCHVDTLNSFRKNLRVTLCH